MLYQTLYQSMRDGTAHSTVPDWAVDALSEIAAGRSSIAGVRHPLGFLCLPMERAGERGVCVHIWSRRLEHGDSTTSATHAHSWDLISYVLFGELRNELVGVTDAPVVPTHRIFEVNSDRCGDEIRRTPRLVRGRRTSSELFRRGDVYSMTAGEFHETVPLGETATVALGHGRPGIEDLTLGPVHTDTHRTRRQHVDHAMTVYAANLVVERLAEMSHHTGRRIHGHGGIG